MTIATVRRFAVALAISATAVLALGTPSAHATDYGGDGNPASGCTGGYTVASAPVVYDGNTVGLVELRWSAACGGNWTRTTSYIGARDLYSKVYLQNDPGLAATSFDTATSHFTRYIRVNPSDRVCAFGQVNVGGATARSAEVCSN